MVRFFFSVPWTFGFRCGHFWHCLLIDCSNSKPFIPSFRERLCPLILLSHSWIWPAVWMLKSVIQVYQPISLCVWLFKTYKGNCNPFSSCFLNRILWQIQLKRVKFYPGTLSNPRVQWIIMDRAGQWDHEGAGYYAFTIRKQRRKDTY